jgi:hypothetical protein
MRAFPLAPYLEFYPVRGNADTPRVMDAFLAPGTTRALGADYTPKSNTPGFGSVTLRMYGDKIQTDMAYERRGYDIGSQRALDLRNVSAGFGRFLMDALVNHTGANLNGNATTKGLKQLSADNSRDVVFDDSSNGGTFPAGNDSTSVKQQAKMIELLIAAANDILGGPTLILCNQWFLARLSTVGRNYMATQQVTDIYTGNNLTVPTFGNIPIVVSGYAADFSTEVITKTETQGTSTGSCTSVYMVRYGEQRDVTVATNRGIDVKDLGLIGSQYQSTIEIDMDQVCLSAKAIKRIKGIVL